MSLPSVLRRPIAFLPLMMSLLALATVLTFITLHGTAPQQDEGAAAHLWQLLMACQAPVILLFAIRWLPRSPKEAVIVIAVQVAAALAAAAPVFLLGW